MGRVGRRGFLLLRRLLDCNGLGGYLMEFWTGALKVLELVLLEDRE